MNVLGECIFRKTKYFHSKGLISTNIKKSLHSTLGEFAQGVKAQRAMKAELGDPDRNE